MDFLNKSKNFQTCYIRKNKYYYIGSLENDTVLIPLYRSNLKKSSSILNRLLDELSQLGLTVFWYQGKSERFKSEIEQSLALFNRSKIGACLIKHSITRKIIFLLFVALRPYYWECIISALKQKIIKRFSSRLNQIDQVHQSEKFKTVIMKQIQEFQCFIKNFPDKNIITISHSAGGMIAAKVAIQEPKIKKLIALGYPFRNPEYPEESYRTEYLEHFNKPLLIIQGRQDEYGGESVRKNYELSSCVDFLFTDDDHNFENVSTEDYQKICLSVQRFLGLGS